MKEKILTVEDQPKPESKELFRVIEVEDTPFNVIERQNDSTDETEYFVTMGKYRLNKQVFLFESEAVEWAKTVSWDKIIQVAGIMIENLNQNQKTK